MDIKEVKAEAVKLVTDKGDKWQDLSIEQQDILMAYVVTQKSK